MLIFQPASEYNPGDLFGLIRRSFNGVLDEELREKIRQYDAEVFENPDTVGACVFISKSDDEVVGMASWNPTAGADIAEIGWLCVLPEFQRRGYGKAQIAEILNRLRKQGFKKVLVKTGEHPFFKNAQKLYTACGFKVSKIYPTGDQAGYGTIEYEKELNL
jgi:GNAT superfamily N-acetyltransferase